MFKFSNSDYEMVRKESFSNFSKIIKFENAERTLFDTIQSWIEFKMRKGFSYKSAVKYVIEKVVFDKIAPNSVRYFFYESNDKLKISSNDIVRIYVKVFEEYKVTPNYELVSKIF